jgi:DNA-binding response OmpR family regulator
LEDNGYKVDSFIDPLLALQNFRASMYDLLLLDIRMPGMNGYELYREMRKIDDKVKVCFLTASEMFYEEFRKLISSGLDENHYIQKPIQNQDLVIQIKSILD